MLGFLEFVIGKEAVCPEVLILFLSLYIQILGQYFEVPVAFFQRPSLLAIRSRSISDVMQMKQPITESIFCQ